MHWPKGIYDSMILSIGPKDACSKEGGRVVRDLEKNHRVQDVLGGFAELPCRVVLEKSKSCIIILASGHIQQ